MGRNFLTVSRHGTTYYFRRRVPDELRSILGKAYLVKTLGACPLGAAIILARSLAARTDELFQRLKVMKKNKPEDIKVDYTLEVCFDDAGLPRKVLLDATPEETEAVQLALAALVQGAASRRVKESSVPLITAKELIDDFFREGESTTRWTDPAKTRGHEYEPIWSRFSKYVEQSGFTIEAVKAYRADVLKEAVTPSTKHRNLYRISTIVRHGVNHHGLDAAMLTHLKINGGGRGSKPKVKNYLPFDHQELEALFHSDKYKNNTFKKPSHFWLPLLGLYTGARLEELAGLHLSAFSIIEGVHALKLSDEETTRGGKNEHAPRVIPVHDELVGIGLIDYVEKLRQVGCVRLFPDIGMAERDGYGKRATTDFTEYRRSVGVGQKSGERSRKVFHSFRSTLSGKLYHLGIDGDLSRRLIGHAAIDVHQGTYLAAAAIPMARASLAMNQITFGLQHPKFTDTEAYNKARTRARRKQNS